MRLPLTKELLTFLQQRGYTHLQLQGIEKKPEEQVNNPELPADDFILIPWKEGIALFEDADLTIEAIDSTDITDMAGVEFGIRFWVELPDEVASLYNDRLKTS